MASAVERDARTIGDALDILAHGRATYPRSRPVRDYSDGRVRVSLGAREVYSYGTHFPLFRFVRRGPRTRPLVVLNGDTWGGPRTRTPDHQAAARRYAAELAETVVIPFSALDGAGIDLDSIRPIHVRPDETWQETVRVESWDDVPTWRRSVWDRDAHASRPLAPDDDGAYTWQETRHRLGDALFSAVREETYTRPARPFEVSRDGASRDGASNPPRVRLEVSPRESYCGAREDSGSGPHEVGPSGACIHCGRPIETRVTVRRRAVYLSSFDYQERAPLYFLAELPRGAGARTVDSALDALAPRAVHAARARGIDVVRQGDVFFIRTRLELAELESRGIVSRARLTQWTRDARARQGETGYVAPLDAAARRRMAEWRRAEWRRTFANALEQVSAPAPLESWQERQERRAARAAEWSAMLRRHELERAAAAAARVGMDEPESGPCPVCNAPIGARCARALDVYRPDWQRDPLAKVHAAELTAFRRGVRAFRGPGPWTDTRGARRLWQERRAAHELELSRSRAYLRRLVFGAGAHRRAPSSSVYGSYYRTESETTRQRRELVSRIRMARETLQRLEREGCHDGLGNRSRAAARDGYRRRFSAGPPALVAWGMSGAAARAKFYPAENHGPTIAKRRERVRRALAIYGTAHSATETVRTRSGAVYVRGTVRHVPELEPGRGGTPDHRPLELGTDGAYWLAVRNTVPRQRTRTL